jgi:hypothetical protein
MRSEKKGTNATTEAAPKGIVSSELASCGVVDAGRAVRLNLLDQAGNSTFVELPFDQAASVVLTLPSLLTRALQVRTGSADARYVLSAAQWALELAQGGNNLLLSLRTEDGFDVCFGISLEMCKDIGSAMSIGIRRATEGGALTFKVH